MKKYVIWLLGGIIIGTLAIIPIKYPDITNNFIAMFNNEYFYRIHGNSMLPTFKDKQMWYGYPCENDSCRHSIKRGSIVVFDATNYDKKDVFVKRVIGLPLEHILITYGSIYVNDSLLNEPYLASSTHLFSGFKCLRYHLGTDQLFVLGDNRSHSNDSRVFGPVYLNDVIGISEFEKYNSTESKPVLDIKNNIKMNEKECPIWTKELVKK